MGGGERKKQGLGLGREQTDKAVISRFSTKLGEALGKIDPSESERKGGEGSMWINLISKVLMLICG